MKKKILSTIISAVCAFATIAAFTVKTPVAKAEVNKENYVLNSFSDSFVATDCEVSEYAKTGTYVNKGTTKYVNGYHVKFKRGGSTVEYNKVIDVSTATEDDVLLEFFPLMDSEKEFRRYEIYVTDSENEEVYVKLSITERSDSKMWSCIQVSARDENAEYETASLYNSAYSKQDQYAFQLQSSLNTRANAQPIKIFWDNANKKLYASPKRDSQSNNLVRDFAIADKDLDLGYTGTTTFGGFTSGKVKIKMVAETVVSAQGANMWLLSIGSEKFARSFGLAKKSETVEVGTEVTLPEITEAWDVKSGSPIDVSGLSPEIEVKNLGGIINLTDNNSFVASEKGVYTARYFVEQNGVTYCAEYEINAVERINNDFYDSFTATANCIPSKQAVTYTTYTNQGVEKNKYNGYNVKFHKVGDSVEYKKAIDVTDNTENDVIFEFIPAVETPGEGKKEFYIFSVYLIDEQDENKYIKLEFKANGDYYTYVNASAKDGDTEFKSASKYQGVYKSDNGFQVGFGLGGLGSAKEFQSLKIYWDNEKKTMEVGSSREGNTVVREFGKSDSELGIDGYTGTKVFGGFTSGKVKVKVVAENVITDYANMTFISVDGEKFARPFGMEEIDYIVKTGDEVALPAVTDGWNVASGKETTITASDYTVTVSCDGETVAVENGKFIPTKSGEYTITYKCTQNGVPYKTEQTIIARDFASDYSLFGAAIRINAADGNNGIRFYAKIKKGLYDELKNRNGFASGTLVIPEKNLGNAELTVDNESALKGDTTEQWYEDGEYMVSVVYLWNIPAANYGDDICARSYITVDGQTYYTEIGKWSMTYVAEYAYANYKDKVSKEKLAEYFGSTLTVTYQTESGEEISTEQVRFADVAKGVADEDGKKVKGYKIRVKGELVDFDITTEILADTTIIVCYE